MKIWGKILIILVVILVIGGLVYLKFYKLKSQPEHLEDLLVINATMEMDQAQKELFEELHVTLSGDSSNYSALTQLARLKQSLGDSDGAVGIYLQLRERKPNDIMILQNLGAIYFDTKQYEKAEATQLAILGVTLKWPNAYRELAMIYQFHLPEKKQTLEPLLLEALAYEAGLREQVVPIAIRYYDDIMHDKEKTIYFLKEKLKLFPDDDVAKKRLAELEAL